MARTTTSADRRSRTSRGLRTTAIRWSSTESSRLNVFERPLVDLLRAFPEIPERARARPREVLAHAEPHGLSGVVHAALKVARVELEDALELDAARRALARDLDHSAHLALLDEIDASLAKDGIAAVALKGALLGERLYPERPSARATSDVDILVAEDDLEPALRALARVGYVAHEGPEEDRFRREHHHLHLSHPAALPLELHFHAYRGFGRTLRGEPLVARRTMPPERRYEALGVLSAEDELVYLAVHAAAHRFVRLGWLWDIKLMLERMTPGAVQLGAERAREWGYARVMSFTAELLVDLLGVGRSVVAPFGGMGAMTGAVARRTVAAPSWPIARAATRFVYTTVLCDTPRAAASYAAGAVLSRARAASR